MKFPVATKKLIDVSDLAFEIREQIFDASGEMIFDSEYFSPNALTNDGQASMLNVWARGTTAPELWMTLLNMPGGAAPTKTSLLTTITEASVIGSNGYVRQQTTTSDWGAPSLSSGDEEMVAAQKTFGAFTGNVPVSHVGLVSKGSTFTGSIFLYVSTAYHTANNTARTFVSGESYLVTMRDKQI
jgi:hypothetical protein